MPNLLVVLNDNDMSISPPVGALNKLPGAADERQVLRRRARGREERAEERAAAVRAGARFEEHAKGMVVPGTIFEEFGFNYVGPIDGHDLDALIPTLENRAKAGPQFLHVVTKKGYGYRSWPRPTR